MSHPRLRTLTLIALLALAPLLATHAVPDKKKLSSRLARKFQKEAAKAAKAGEWDRVADLIEKLAPANKKRTYQFMSKMARQAPASSRVPMALVKAAEVMDHRSVQKEIQKDLTGHPSMTVRRGLLGVFAKRKDWKIVIKSLSDKEEEVAYVAAWQLAEHKVEAGIEPMISAMEKLDKTQEGVWYELRHLLGKLLGKRLNNGAEYRSWWTQVKEKGGLKSVKPPKKGSAPDPNASGSTSLRFFGRSIDSNRVLFILDVSSSMDIIDRIPMSGRVRSPTSSPKGAKPPPRKPRKNRLQRAQHQLKRVLERLSSRTRINILTFSSKTRIRFWKEEGGQPGDPPILHPLTKENRADAIKFVDTFRAIGSTATDLALKKAYTIKGARCFYLLSDGAPTHGGSKIIPTEEILDVVRQHDRGRHIRIHTLGFKGAKKEMMEALAAGTGGSYSDIPPE